MFDHEEFERLRQKAFTLLRLPRHDEAPVESPSGPITADTIAASFGLSHDQAEAVIDRFRAERPASL